MSNANATLKWNTAVCSCEAHKKEVRKHLEKIAGVEITKISIANGKGEVTMNITSTVDLHTVIKKFPITDERRKKVELFLSKPRDGESRQTPWVILKWNTAVCDCYSDQEKKVRKHLKNIGGVTNIEINIANGQGKVTMNITSTVDLYTVIKKFPITDERRKRVELFLKEREPKPGESRQTPWVILKWNTVGDGYSDQEKKVRKHLANIGGVGIGKINIDNGRGKVIMNINSSAIELHTVIKEFPITDKTRETVTLFLKEN